MGCKIVDLIDWNLQYADNLAQLRLVLFDLQCIYILRIVLCCQTYMQRMQVYLCKHAVSIPY